MATPFLGWRPDREGVRDGLSWGEGHVVDERTAVTAAEIADELGPQGPVLNAMDALFAAVERELDAPVGSTDRHPITDRALGLAPNRQFGSRHLAARVGPMLLVALTGWPLDP